MFYVIVEYNLMKRNYICTHLKKTMTKMLFSVHKSFEFVENSQSLCVRKTGNKCGY